MGNAASKENLYDAVNAGDELWMTDILTRNPSLTNKPFTSDGQSTPVIRSAFTGKAHLLVQLVKLGADLNVAGSTGRTALMWAAAKG
jgi:ankyrin repeat protein